MKNYNELSSRQQQRRRAKIQDGVREYLRSLPASNGLEPISLHLGSQDDNNEQFSVSLEDDAKARAIVTRKEDESDDALLPKIAFILLKYGVSKECYHELSMCIPGMLRSYKVMQCI